MNLSQKIQSELQAMKNLFGARLCGSIDITSYLFKKETLIEEVNILKKSKVREMKSLVYHLKKKKKKKQLKMMKVRKVNIEISNYMISILIFNKFKNELFKIYVFINQKSMIASD